MSSGNSPALSKAVIFSLSGPCVTEGERAFFSQTAPFGFILFKRNIEDPAQLAALVRRLRECAGWECPVLIDQEGGRVQRMGPPHWPAYPAAGCCAGTEEVAAVSCGIAKDLAAVGIDVNCAPVLDVLFEQTHEAIGDRAFSSDVDDVLCRGKKTCEMFLERGVTPVLKHLPGQGRAAQDSHHDLPVVAASLADLRAVDFVPFKGLLAEPFAPALWGMVSHIVYQAIDPDRPASVSRRVIEVIRQDIGWNGLLLSDDISMGALDSCGPLEDRCKAMLEAGCDIALYCAGNLEEMKKIAACLPALRPESLERYERSRRIRRRPAA
ncbi:MAG: glycoside hydrolase family 3 protein [Rhodospirillales bacterium]|nr:glycoside hydrolase family 3 protein [Alphaproteobacteria bacterium]USO04488.1 MAG: glycoside hydrolase family 3 protein [Rhodospirillales bacterium]